MIPPVVANRGSFIRVFFADLNADGRPEVVATNKGAQSPTVQQDPTAISRFDVKGNPLDGRNWLEHELIRVVWPINSQPVDLDGDGDIDVVGGSVAERRIILFENRGGTTPVFRGQTLRIVGTSLTGTDRPVRLELDPTDATCDAARQSRRACARDMPPPVPAAPAHD